MCGGAANVISIEHHDTSLYMCTFTAFVPERNKLRHRYVKSLGQLHNNRDMAGHKVRESSSPQGDYSYIKTRFSQTLMLSQITEDLVIVQAWLHLVIVQAQQAWYGATVCISS